jgi:hypothetical protein
MYENNKGINIMKKIAILLLGASSSFLVASNIEINACKAGVNARAAGTNVDLLVTGAETTRNGTKPCASFTGIGTRAACIFGYNTKIPILYNSNEIPGNGCDKGVFFNECPSWFNYNPAGCSGGGGACCVCGYPGTKDSAGKPDGYGVCEYGSDIGWNLSPSSVQTLGNFYYNKFVNDTSIISKLWGTNRGGDTPSVAYINWLRYINVYINQINKWTNKNDLFTGFADNIPISGADAVRMV